MKKYILPNVCLLLLSLGVTSALAADAPEGKPTPLEEIKTTPVTLDVQTSSELQSQVDSLMKEISEKGYASDSREWSYGTKQDPSKPAPAPAPPKSKKWAWPSLGFAFKREENRISEAEVLYKTAVSDGKVTVEEAVDIGLANNKMVQAARVKIDAANAKYTETKRAFFPTVQAVTEVNGGHAPNNLRLYKGRNSKINVNQPVFYGGELILTAKQAQENLKSAKADYERIKNQLTQEIKTQYYGVVRAEYNLQYQFEIYQKSYPAYRRTREEFHRKLLSDVDFLNAESQYQQIFFQVESAQNDLSMADVLLHQALNIGTENPMPVDLKLSFSKVDPVFEEMLVLVMKNNADIRVKSYAVEYARYGVGIYQAKKLPRIDLKGSWGELGEQFQDEQALDPNHPFYTGNERDVDTEKEWFIGVHASVPLGPNTVEYEHGKHVYAPTVSAFQGSDDYSYKLKLNLFDNLANITDEKSAEAAYLQSQGELQKSQNEVTAKLREDFYNLQKSLIRMDAAVSRMRYYEKQNNIFEYTLSLQEIRAGDYFESLIEQAQSKAIFIQSVTDYQLAVSSLALSVGDSHYFEKKAKGKPSNG